MSDQSPTGQPTSLSQLWQMPVLLLGIVLLGAGLVMSIPEDTHIDIPEIVAKSEEHIDKGEFVKALEELDQLKPYLETMSNSVRGRYHLLRARTYYLGRRSRAQTVQAEPADIVHEYDRVIKYAGELRPQDKERMAENLLLDGKMGRAMEILQTITDSGARQRLLRQTITKSLENEIEDPTRDKLADTFNLIDQFISEVENSKADGVVENAESRNQLIWGIARQAQCLLMVREPEACVDMLLRRIARLQSDVKQQEGAADDPATDAMLAGLGELMVMLGKAYLQIGNYAEAEIWLQSSRQQLSEQNPLNGDAEVALGEIEFAKGHVNEAMEHFDIAATNFPNTPSYLDALIGRAECAVRIQATENALADFETASDLIDQATVNKAAQTQKLMASLATQHSDRVTNEDYEGALRFLDLQAKVVKGDLPPKLLHDRATTHVNAARKLADLGKGDQLDDNVLKSLDAVKRSKLFSHYEEAANNFLAHARSMQVQDDTAYGDSLWQAADAYSKARLHTRAIEVFEEFRNGRPNDPLHLQAIYRMAQAYEADRDFVAATKLYKQLNDDNPKSLEAYASLVPLARSYLAQGARYVDRAEHVLLRVVSDHPALGPDSNEYQEALQELGRLYYHRGNDGDYEKSIRRFREVVGRYEAEDNALPDIHFLLGDAYRKSVEAIDTKIKGGLLPPRQLEAQRDERELRLENALKSFDKVVKVYNPVNPDDLSPIQQLYLRNSFFYRGECAYELKVWEGPNGAIQYYDEAVRRYSDDPSALVALMQIVNCYCQLKQFDEARKANERAKWHLKTIPEERFNDPDLPLNREHWQNWLKWIPRLAASDANTPLEDILPPTEENDTAPAAQP